MFTRVEVSDQALRKKLHIYALLAPHMKGLGQHNSAWWYDLDGRPLFHVAREDNHMVFGATPAFTRRSVGYVGYSDGWQDIMDNFKMDWEFQQAIDGNVALTGEIDLSKGFEFVLGAAFGHSPQSASTRLLQSLAAPFQQHLSNYLRQWKRTLPGPQTDLSDQTGDGGHLYRLSRLVLLAHEDKVYPGALVASMSIPWGETKGDADLGGYHLVWTRDLVKSASALLAILWFGWPASRVPMALCRKIAGSMARPTGSANSLMKWPPPFCWPGACNNSARLGCLTRGSWSSARLVISCCMDL